MNLKFIRLIISAIIIGMTLAGTASAENSLNAGAKGLSFGIVDSVIEISGRMFLQGDLALLAGFGLLHSDNDENTTDYSVSAGMRKYLKKTDLAPFVGGILSYHREEFEVIRTGSTVSVESEKTLEIAGVFGAEYFFARQVSVEAQVGLGIADVRNVNGSGADVTSIGTFSSGVTLNLYFP